MNKEKDFWDSVSSDMYSSGEFDDPSLSGYEFDILKRLKINKGHVLEIGPGTGRDIKKFNKLGFKLNAIDISSNFIDKLNNKYDGCFVEGDTRNIDKFFSNIDLIYSIWSIMSLEYQEFKSFLFKASKVINEKGHILMSLKFGSKLDNIHPISKLQSLQLNARNLIKALPKNLEILFLEVTGDDLSSSEQELQITFALGRIN